MVKDKYLDSDEREDEEEDSGSHPVVDTLGSVFMISLLMTIACGIVYYVPQIAFPFDHPIHAYGSEPIFVSPLAKDKWENKTETAPVEEPAKPVEETEPPAPSDEQKSEEEVTWGERLIELIQWWSDNFNALLGPGSWFQGIA